MENQVRIDVETNATALPPSAGLTNRVFIDLHHITEEFLQDPSGTQTLIGSYLASPAHPITFSLLSSSHLHILELLHERLQNPELCEYLAFEIAPVATQIGLGLQGFFMYVHVTLIEARLVLVSSPPVRGAPEDVIQRLVQERMVNFQDLKTRNLESTTCAICLDEFVGSDCLINMPCSHLFHHLCILEWLNNQSSCPLCRRLL